MVNIDCFTESSICRILSRGQVPIQCMVNIDCFTESSICRILSRGQVPYNVW